MELNLSKSAFVATMLIGKDSEFDRAIEYLISEQDPSIESPEWSEKEPSAEELESYKRASELLDRLEPDEPEEVEELPTFSEFAEAALERSYCDGDCSLEPLIPRLRRELVKSEHSPEVRIRILKTLGTAFESISDFDDEQRIPSAEELACVPAFEYVYDENYSDELRALAISGLSMVTDRSSTLPLMLRALIDPNPKVAVSAVMGIYWHRHALSADEQTLTQAALVKVVDSFEVEENAYHLIELLVSIADQQAPELLEKLRQRLHNGMAEPEDQFFYDEMIDEAISTLTPRTED